MASVSLEQGPKKLVVKATPGRTLAEILTEFCDKFGLKSEEWTLNFKQKAVDLALPFRLSGIPQNAKLEVVKRAKSGQDASAPVQVGLQLPTGDRVVESFAPRTSLWDVLQHFERARATTFTSAEDPKTSNYIQPVLSFLNREISSNKELRNTTLEILGLSPGSNGLLRLVMKQTDVKFLEFMKLEKESLVQEAEDRERLEKERNAKQEQLKKDQQESQMRAAEAQARIKEAEEEEQKKRDHMRKLMMEEAVRLERERQLKEQADQLREQQKLQREEQERMWRQQKLLEEQERARQESHRLAEEIAAGTSSKSSKSNDDDAMDVSPPSSTAQPAEKEDKMDVDTVPVWDRIPSEPLDRNPTSFAPSDSPFDGSQIELPDDFFEMDAEDFAREAQIQADKKRRQENEKSFLRTKAVRDRERIQKYAKFKKCYIRVRFPDRLELQGTFYPQEKTSHIVQFVRDCLTQPDLPFYLYTTPPMTRLSETANIRDQGLLPAALVHFGLPQGVTAQSPLVKPELLQGIKEKLPPSSTISSSASLNFSLPAQLKPEATSASGSASSSSHAAPSKDTTDQKSQAEGNKVPKWFAAGLKKK